MEPKLPEHCGECTLCRKDRRYKLTNGGALYFCLVTGMVVQDYFKRMDGCPVVNGGLINGR